MAAISRIIAPGLIVAAMTGPVFVHAPDKAAVVAAAPHPAPAAAPLPPAAADPVSAFASSTVAMRGAGGTFHVAGAVNGRSLDMLVDTGADLVAIPADQAPGLGVAVQPDQFRPVLRTASGTANGAVTRVDSLVVGQRELRDVDAVVVEGLDRVLLGQSALRRLGNVTIAGDRMEIGGE
jgi:aspartyl protease family protein